MARITYDAPPVVEVVLGLQFAPLPNYTAAHAGMFWQRALGDAWTNFARVPAIPEQFEKFGDDIKWEPLVPGGVKLLGTLQPDRIQISKADRMVQLQASRFHLNWRGDHGADYPRYDVLRPEFVALVHQFEALVDEKHLGELTLNQWEVTYINHLLAGDGWSTPDDWRNVFSGFWSPAVGVNTQKLDLLLCQWRYEIVPGRGRVHINLRDGRQVENDQDLLALQITARGPVPPNSTIDLAIAGLDTGHTAIVESFDAMTSETMHRIWKKRS